MAANTNVACIGAGHWGKNLVRNFHDLNALSIVCETDGGRRAALKAEYPDLEVTDDPAAVFANPAIRGVAIATPAESHGQLVRDAVVAGKDVMVEKPLCLSLDEAKQL